MSLEIIKKIVFNLYFCLVCLFSILWCLGLPILSINEPNSFEDSSIPSWIDSDGDFSKCLSLARNFKEIIGFDSNIFIFTMTLDERDFPCLKDKIKAKGYSKTKMDCKSPLHIKPCKILDGNGALEMFIYSNPKEPYWILYEDFKKVAILKELPLSDSIYRIYITHLK